MRAIPTRSAVLLMHNAHGAFPIASSGGLSGQATHTLAYDGRQGRYEEQGGCDREMTAEDARLMDLRLSSEAASHLDYVAREGAWASRAAAMAEDCSYWGQHGPLRREDIEQDMLVCGGAYLKSVVSVDRRYAADLGLDSKEAFQKLMRDNWQQMMVAAGAGDRMDDIHWYACYHTDAKSSLHVHVCTWAGGGRIQEGWHPSARATCEQKAFLYRDAYASIRHERNLEHDYYRMLLPKLAAAELGFPARKADAERLRAKAAMAGVKEVPLVRTLDDGALAEARSKLDVVTEKLQAGSGRKARDWRLHSDAGKVVKSIERNSAAFAAALARYRELVEAKADMCGLAVEGPAAEGAKGAAGKAQRERENAARDVTRHERDRFVREEMGGIMRRIRNQVIRSANPAGREGPRLDAKNPGGRSLVQGHDPKVGSEQQRQEESPPGPTGLVAATAAAVARGQADEEAVQAAERKARPTRAGSGGMARERGNGHG